MKSALFLFASLLLISTAACAESFSASGSFAPNSGYYFQYYQIYIPENATRVSVSITNTSPDSIMSCYNVYEYLKVGGRPCSDALYNGAANLCLQKVDFAPSLYGGNHTTTLSFDSGDEWYEFAVGQDLFVGVGTELKYNSTCTYAISAIVESCNSTDDVGLFDYFAIPGHSGSSSNFTGPAVECIKYDAIAKNGDTFILTGNSPSNSVYYLDVPANIAWVEATLDASTDANYPANTAFSITGRNFGASNIDTAFNCSTHSYIMDNDTSTYRYSIRCDAPAAGSWYWTVRNGDSESGAAYDGQVVFTWQQCNETAGWDCAYPMSSLSVATAQNFEITLSPSSEAINQSTEAFGAECNYQYYMFEAQPEWNQIVNITCWNNQTGWLYVRRNGYPTSYIYDLAVNCTANGYASWIPQDFYPGGTWYLAVCNPSVENSTFYLSVTSANASTSTSSSSTASTTAGSTTGAPSTLYATTGSSDVTTESSTGVTSADSTTTDAFSSPSNAAQVQIPIVSVLILSVLHALFL